MKVTTYKTESEFTNYLGYNYNSNWFNETDTFISYSVFKNKERTELHIYYK